MRQCSNHTESWRNGTAYRARTKKVVRRAPAAESDRDENLTHDLTHDSELGGRDTDGAESPTD